MIQRICFSILIMISLLFLPFWVSVILAIGGIVFFSIYWEASILFFLSDLIFNTKETKLFGILFFSFVACIILTIGIELLKKKLRFYKIKDNVAI